MTSAELIWYLGGGGAAIILLISISFWSVNFFIKQFTERTYEKFREHLAKEVEIAIRIFREGLSEQIAAQEKKTDSLAKLYATLIDLLRVGRDFAASCGKGDPKLTERRLRSISELGITFGELYQKENLHFPEELCTLLDGFIVEQKDVMQAIERDWFLKDAAERSKGEAEIKQSWLRFEDRVIAVMDQMRNEFRRRNQAPGSIMLKWLNELPPPKVVSGTEAKM